MTRTLTLLVLGISAIACRAEWKPLFNGKDLAGWSGDPRLWRVENGVLVGETNDTDKKAAANTFLIWQGGEPGDFTLEYKARITGNNNSGVQYRSKVLDAAKWSVGGYQMDLHPKAEYLGMLYEERGRGIACQRGQKVSLDAKPQVTGKLEIADVNLAEWNTFRIVAKGNVLQHFVNDQLAAEITDVNPQKRADKGVIALQAHAGPAMKAEFKDLRINEAAAPAPAGDPKAEAPRKKKRDAVAAPQDGAAIVDVTENYQVMPGFRLERIYQVPKSQGSWVAMTVDGGGRLICADQHGAIYRVDPPAGDSGAVRTELLDLPLKGAHGLLWHKGVLWVSVNEDGGKAGVWKVTDANGDGEPDTPVQIKKLRGGGEHGPHALVAAPDGNSIYLVAGNHTDLPEFDRSLVTKAWAEDQLLPRRPDARGHATGRMAPGGWIARFDPDGKNWELFSCGYRNSYDMAFNEHGDAFTYDSDMEWDLGMPWYRPTRFCHVVPGSEFGWRFGTGKWPACYEDSMPAQLDIGPGSPTGVLSGKGAKFPAKYQRAIFGLDWTFATLYAVHLTPNGRGYSATREEFIAGKGLPLTDAVIGADGAMYFLTGGRGGQSALWRVTYVGGEATDPVPYQSKPLALVDSTAAVKQLGSQDRIARFEARTALEQQGADAVLRELTAAPSDPWRVIGAAIALARVGKAENVSTLIDALDALDWASLDPQQRINWLRAAGLAFARHGEPDGATRAKVLAKINDKFPSGDPMLDRELCRLLAYLNAPGVVARTLNLMDASGPEPAPDWLELAKRNSGYGGTVEKMIANLPPAQVIHYVYCLRVVPGPWHGDERKRFFNWLGKLSGNSGGASYTGFIDDLRKQTIATSTPEEQKLIATFNFQPPPNPFANLPAVAGPGREWTVDAIVASAAEGLGGRSSQRGHDIFRASLCAACHRFGNEGGSTGPDLSNLSGRFTVRDLAESIVHPGAVISDQYRFEIITRSDGTQVVGRIIEAADDKWIVATNPYDLGQTVEITRDGKSKVTPSPVSPMPPGLINRLNADELKDLLAFLLKTP
jgi:putative heme-binding domain-containing protein